MCTVFTVPETKDMVSQLFSPTSAKNFSDAVLIGILGIHILLLVILPRGISIPLFAVVYTFWRASYNGGIGFVLWQQSNYNAVVAWTKKTGIFNDPATGKNTLPKYYKLLKREMETKIPKDYKFEEAPIEYNTWLLFRRGVDLILMCDFVSYCCFAVACGGRPQGENVAMTVARWSAGIGLFLFNLWVKLDAHRVVKDFAWYWGDFFFLIDQELTFDGVFEMAPHPMYSVGYAGYYGISLMAASYKVLFISIFAHAAQFAFLSMVENPHIEKVYNPPPTRQRARDDSTSEQNTVSPSEFDQSADRYSSNGSMSDSNMASEPSHIRNMIGVANFDLHRVVDVSAVLLQFYIYTLALITPSTPIYQAFFVVNAVFWRLWYSIGIGYILDRQSKKRNWTRHYIKWGETKEEAWRQWKGIYHLSMTLCYVSFVCAAYKMYSIPADWEYGMTILRHVLGTALIALQLWTVFSIYESLGEFGWFFGDFFYDRGPKLTYSGIYRFLNNPERVIGLAGVWGFAIITWSKSIIFLALLSHVLTLCFIQFVERPHMEKRYGQRLRQQSGLSKSFKRSLPGPIQKWTGSVDRALEDTADLVDELLDSARPRLMAGIDDVLKTLRRIFTTYLGRLNLTRVASSTAGFNPTDYTLAISGTPSPASPSIDKASLREGDMARTPTFRGAHFQPEVLEYGAPITVRWTAPLHHSKRDWVGLYMIADNSSRAVTRIASQGRWISTTRGAYDYARAEQGILVNDKQLIQWQGEKGVPLMTGELEFSGDKLWWTTGVFEFRYHHDGKHNVMAISRPFEIRIARFDEDDVDEVVQDAAQHDGPAQHGLQVSTHMNADAETAVRQAVEAALLPMVRNCFDRDPEIAPTDVEEAFGGLVEREGKFARRVVFAVWQMYVFFLLLPSFSFRSLIFLSHSSHSFVHSFARFAL